MFGINGWEMVALAVIALLIFGPDRLPKAAADAGQLLRQVRTMIANARRDLNESLGPELKNFDIADLNPRHLVRKHLLDPVEIDDLDGSGSNGRDSQRRGSTSTGSTPYDSDAT